MDIHHLKVFLSVFKNKSFSRASEELYLTQPTISDHIKTLEEELECKLFDRLGRTILPTKEAEILYAHATSILEKIGTLKDTFNKLKKEVTGDLLIGASTIPGTYLMPKVIADFYKKYPGVSVQVAISDTKGIIDKIIKHELLLGIVGSKISNSPLNFVPFIEDELVVVASPSLTNKPTLSLDELANIPMVLREEGSGTRKEMEKILEGKGINMENIKIAGMFGSTDAIKQAVKSGLGISIVSKLSVADELKHKILKEIKLDNIQMKRKFYIVSHKKRTLPLAYSIFLEYIKANL